jgi:hypothetical protein
MIFTDYGIGKIESTQVINLASSIQHQAKMGVCTTGNSLDAYNLDHLHMDQNKASVKDMEAVTVAEAAAVAIAWSYELHQTPHFGMKVVTDIADGDKPTQEEFREKLHRAVESLQEAVPKAIEYICGKGHDEL